MKPENKTTTKKSPMVIDLLRLVRLLNCSIGRHDIRVAQQITRQGRRTCCLKCGKSWAMNDDVRAYIKWDQSFHDLYVEDLKETIIYLPCESFRPTPHF